jgi:4-hydroxythreonine-4-phosphate dehydrogenase
MSISRIIFHLDNLNGFVEPGIESGAAGKAAASYIEAAVNLCAAGSIDAMATAPINKRALFLGGYSFPGHTEFLAALTATEEYAMGFVAANLRIVLLSTHVPLAEAIRMVRKGQNRKKRFAWPIASTSMGDRTTAHCGRGIESARCGRRTVRNRRSGGKWTPAIESCRVADGALTFVVRFQPTPVYLRASRGEFDAVHRCYHDQAMIPVKLPFVRKSGLMFNARIGRQSYLRRSWHRFDIACKGHAEHSRWSQAIKLAAELSLKSGELAELWTRLRRRYFR